MTECRYEVCVQPAYAKELCTGHYQQVRRGKQLMPLASRGRWPKVCTFEDCKNESRAVGLCAGHHQQSLRGLVMTALKSHSLPVGTTHERADGYVDAKYPEHLNSRRGWVSEHVKVMSEMLGRPLLPGENVHHINGVRNDNRPENLELWITKQPKGQRVSDRVTDAVEILNRYAPDLLA